MTTDTKKEIETSKEPGAQRELGSFALLIISQSQLMQKINWDQLSLGIRESIICIKFNWYYSMNHVIKIEIWGHTDTQTHTQRWI